MPRGSSKRALHVVYSGSEPFWQFSTILDSVNGGVPFQEQLELPFRFHERFWERLIENHHSVKGVF